MSCLGFSFFLFVTIFLSLSLSFPLPSLLIFSLLSCDFLVSLSCCLSVYLPSFVYFCFCLSPLLSVFLHISLSLSSCIPCFLPLCSSIWHYVFSINLCFSLYCNLSLFSQCQSFVLSISVSVSTSLYQSVYFNQFPSLSVIS